MEGLIKKKLNMSPIHKELSNLHSNKTQIDYDATLLLCGVKIHYILN